MKILIQVTKKKKTIQNVIKLRNLKQINLKIIFQKIFKINKKNPNKKSLHPFKQELINLIQNSIN